MNANIQTLPPAAVNTKPLWAAVGGLGVAVLALGASLVYVQTRPVDGQTALAAIETAAPAADSQTAAAGLPVATVAANEVVLAPASTPQTAKAAPIKAVEPRRAAVAATAPAPTTAPVVVATAPAAVPVATPVPAPVPAPAAAQPYVVKTICASCGTIESVTPVTRKGSTQGVGAVAGGVLGAVVGNQIGGGGGRTLATIIGAVGGGVAGNAIEKNIKKETVFQVQVRMEDGSVRSLEQASAPAVGARVIVEGDTLHNAVKDSGVVSTSTAPQV